MRGENVARRQLGPECQLVKTPFMPRLAQALDTFLARGGAGQLAAGAAAVLLSYYFGWRSSTAASLRAQHVTWVAATGVF